MSCKAFSHERARTDEACCADGSRSAVKVSLDDLALSLSSARSIVSFADCAGAAPPSALTGGC